MDVVLRQVCVRNMYVSGLFSKAVYHLMVAQ